ncbi:MAG TPA: hypothetical protein VFZ75_09060 [Actinomycetota bacterium]|nr:hypothetical protein [Actinomycetota bacterium]
MKRALLAGGLAIFVGGIVVGAVGSAPVSSIIERPGTSTLEMVLLQADQPDDAVGGEQGGDVHGGPIQRFHVAGACGLVAVSGLPGNWTHGDYVSAVAATIDDPAMMVEAAHSDCGKPMHAVGQGGGPPAHAQAKGLKGKAASEESS